MISRSQIFQQRRWVVKVGSAVLTNNGLTVSEPIVARLATQISKLRSLGVDVVLVSSGAVAAGLGRLDLKTRPEGLNELQAAAAVGQAALIQAWDRAFSKHNVVPAQVLLTHSDIANRERYLNARNTLQGLLKMGALPIVNENDTVATDEIRVGDNDNLAALVVNLVDADLLVLLTDQSGLFDADPRTRPDAQLIEEADAGNMELLKVAGEGSALGRGGMRTKLIAAEKASRAGASTVIAQGRSDDVLGKIYAGETVGTLLRAQERLRSRKQWMAGQMRGEGFFELDAGACRVIQEHGRSLLAVGVTQVRGTFPRGALITCCDEAGREIARGLTNYSSEEVQKILGLRSEDMHAALGYVGDNELIHRDNLVLI